MPPKIFFNRVAKSIGILDQNRNVSENESVLAVYLDVHDSFCARVGAQDVVSVVEEEDGAVWLGLVLLVLVLHVLCEELQVSVAMLVAVEGLEVLVRVVDVVVFVHED